MTLASLIRGGILVRVATATSAIPATGPLFSPPSVAAVATIAVTTATKPAPDPPRFGFDPLPTAGVVQASANHASREDASSTQLGLIPRTWAEGVARLDPARPPTDVPSRYWRTFIDDCRWFLDSGWAAKATALGWGPLELFGSHRSRPFARTGWMGLIWLLEGRKLLALTAAEAVIETSAGKPLVYRCVLTRVETVLAWELVR